jgi:hypothetical protein
MKQLRFATGEAGPTKLKSIQTIAFTVNCDFQNEIDYFRERL